MDPPHVRKVICKEEWEMLSLDDRMDDGFARIRFALYRKPFATCRLFIGLIQSPFSDSARFCYSVDKFHLTLQADESYVDKCS
ncbi:Na [Trichuris trichiura]|uniref:Na n=1 Tax=Trichuris trichiura TaxID=36087 RepID=A0A077YWW0_TRITR|nr:Na [Trichuris trichiura]